MKATITILAAVLTLQAGILFAGNENIASVSNESSSISMTSLAPATPVEATFEDMATYSLTDLMPVMPSEATFDDMPALMPSIADLSPEIPAMADFDDVVDEIDNGILAPITPDVADFE